MNELERKRSQVCNEINEYINSLYGRNSPAITNEIMKLSSKFGITMEEFILWTHNRECGREEFRVE